VGCNDPSSGALTLPFVARLTHRDKPVGRLSANVPAGIFVVVYSHTINDDGYAFDG